MSDDVKLVITGTFGVIALAWVLLNASSAASVTNGLASSYATAVGALKPSGG